jgi:hypothetical protein
MEDRLYIPVGMLILAGLVLSVMIVSGCTAVTESVGPQGPLARGSGWAAGKNWTCGCYRTTRLTRPPGSGDVNGASEPDGPRWTARTVRRCRPGGFLSPHVGTRRPCHQSGLR